MLEKARLIKRTIGLESHELLWMLTTEGGRTAGVSIPKSKWSKNMLEHDHQLIALRIQLEWFGVARSWTPEHVIRSLIFQKHGLKGMKDRIVPDAFMAIEVNGAQESIAIELELTLKNKTKLRKTLKRYIEKGRFHALWYVAPKLSILNSVWRQWLSIGGANSTMKFYASLLPEVMQDPSKARLMGPKPHRIISEAWSLRSVRPSAQVVSRQIEPSENEKVISSNDDHTPN